MKRRYSRGAGIVLGVCGLSLLLPAGAGGPAATGLYQERVEAARPTGKQLRDSGERLEKQWPVREEEAVGVPPFHHRVASPPPARGTLCGDCHTVPPHRRDRVRRGVFHRHSQRIDCTVCHWRRGDERMEYRWLSFPGLRPVGPPAQAGEEGVRIGALADGKPVTVPSDTAFARSSREAWESASSRERVQLHARLHAPLEAKGPVCRACHRRDRPLLDLERLGYGEEARLRLQNHPIPRYIDRLEAREQQRVQLLDLLAP